MRSNWRLRLAALTAALVAALAATLATTGATAYADHGCQAGTSWDNLTQTCR
jgi:hypothetical protein